MTIKYVNVQSVYCIVKETIVKNYLYSKKARLGLFTTIVTADYSAAGSVFSAGVSVAGASVAGASESSEEQEPSPQPPSKSEL
tara:strand:+ start:753 stop:1001 length:249 start_codon:yes stop_codon:yes gene_type:complete